MHCRCGGQSLPRVSGSFGEVGVWSLGHDVGEFWRCFLCSPTCGLQRAIHMFMTVVAHLSMAPGSDTGAGLCAEPPIRRILTLCCCGCGALVLDELRVLIITCCRLFHFGLKGCCLLHAAALRHCCRGIIASSCSRGYVVGQSS